MCIRDRTRIAESDLVDQQATRSYRAYGAVQLQARVQVAGYDVDALLVALIHAVGFGRGGLKARAEEDGVKAGPGQPRIAVDRHRDADRTLSAGW